MPNCNRRFDALFSLANRACLWTNLPKSTHYRSSDIKIFMQFCDTTKIRKHRPGFNCAEFLFSVLDFPVIKKKTKIKVQMK